MYFVLYYPLLGRRDGVDTREGYFLPLPGARCPKRKMPKIIIGLCTVEFEFPGVTSLKEKRSILKSLLTRLHNTFNISAAEIDYQDAVNSGVIAFTTVTNDTRFCNQTISTVLNWIEANYPDALIVNQEIEIL